MTTPSDKWAPDTVAVRGGLARSAFEETSEALYLTSGFVYQTAEDAEAAASYSISTVSGRLQLDDTRVTNIRGRYTAKHGELDRRWTDFRVNGVSADVSVLHTARTTASA